MEEYQARATQQRDHIENGHEPGCRPFRVCETHARLDEDEGTDPNNNSALITVARISPR
jgi:hypothetical protein